jgi:tubulin epsilon
MKQLTDYADCVMPIDNQSLINIVNKVESFFSSSNSSSSTGIHKTSLNTKRYDPSKVVHSQLAGSGTIISNEQSVSAQKRNEKPFDSMNNIVANMLLNLTSSSRFEGSLNVDLNEITMNLVPYPRIHYLLSSLSPLYISEKVNVQVRGIEQMFSDAFKRDQQLLQCDPKSNLYLACGLMVRDQCPIIIIVFNSCFLL